MEIDYRNMMKLIVLRQKQIDDASKEYPYFNEEWRNLEQIKQSLAVIIVLERSDPKEYDEAFDAEDIASENIDSFGTDEMAELQNPKDA